MDDTLNFGLTPRIYTTSSTDGWCFDLWTDAAIGWIRHLQPTDDALAFRLSRLLDVYGLIEPRRGDISWALGWMLQRWAPEGQHFNSPRV